MYRNICSFTKDAQSYIWVSKWDEKGKRITEVSPVKPYLYYEVPAKESYDAMSMFRTPLKFIEFDNIYDRNDFIKNTLINKPLFNKFSPAKQYLFDNYKGLEQTPEFAQYPFKTFFLDMEVEVADEFPKPEEAKYPINVISLFDTETNTVNAWVYHKNIDSIFNQSEIDNITQELYQDYLNQDQKVNIRRFDNEAELLQSFINFWESNPPDIVTGWNIDRFDILYIINRINRIFETDEAYRLSPVKQIKYPVRVVSQQQLKQTVSHYEISGISICDYMNLYKKFVIKSQQSWKLDYIAKLETGRGKLDYYEMGFDSIKDFMTKDFTTFVKYNIIDTILVKEIDDKRQFIKLMRRICNIGLCEYENIFSSIPYIVGSLALEAHYNGVKFLTDSNIDEKQKEDSDGYTGGFVFPTKPGFYKNGVMSFDFNSLYPNCIISTNCSPDTFIGKIITGVTSDSVQADEVIIKKPNKTYIKLKKDKLNSLLNDTLTVSGSGLLFYKTTHRTGILPKFLMKLYEKRVQLKKSMLKYKQQAHEYDSRILELKEKLKELI